VRPAGTFCNCSAGFHKKPFEVAFGQPVKVEVLESVLLGGERCRFAIHLPEEAIPAEE
jgi:predicted hydrocarbon binding protein